MPTINKSYLLSLLSIILSANLSAHSGRTDANGGHTDKSTGLYHYHNKGKAKTSPVKAKTSSAKVETSSAKVETSPASSNMPTSYTKKR